MTFRPGRSPATRLAMIALLLGAAACREETVRGPVERADAGERRAHVASLDVSVTDSIIFPAGPDGVAAQRGLAIMAATRDSMPGYVGSSLRCFSCHLDSGRRANAIPLRGVYGRFPAYNSRDNRVISIQDRVNNCFRRSLAGRDIPMDGPEMNAIVMYLAVLSKGVPVGAQIPGEGMAAIPDLTGDSARGAAIFTAHCARCHGDHGQGIPPATPLWGPRSFSVGASLARVSRAATFIRHNMPFDSAGVLTDQQAYDVAAYVTSHPRPDAPGKELDWSGGGTPRDVPYATRGHVAYRPPPLLPSALR